MDEKIDNGSVFGALLTDLWKTFDYLPHELLIATAQKNEVFH